MWIAEADECKLPEDVLALRKCGLEIRTTRDIGPFKKVIPALQAYPSAVIVTADDDVYYWRTWLEELVAAWSGSTREIVCHRANEIKLDSLGLPVSYSEWPMGSKTQDKSVSIFPTGVEGVLYPPGSLSPTVLDSELFMKACPRADDVWLYWMARLAGSTFKLTGHGRRLCMWRNSQDIALYHVNVLQNGNDPQIQSMIYLFGWPPGSQVSEDSATACRTSPDFKEPIAQISGDSKRDVSSAL